MAKFGLLNITEPGNPGKKEEKFWFPTKHGKGWNTNDVIIKSPASRIKYLIYMKVKMRKMWNDTHVMLCENDQKFYW